MFSKDNSKMINDGKESKSTVTKQNTKESSTMTKESRNLQFTLIMNLKDMKDLMKVINLMEKDS